MDIRKILPFACKSAAEWCETQPDIDTALAVSKRGDWIIYAADQLGVSSRLIALAVARCADMARHLMTDQKLTFAVDISLRYSTGEYIPSLELADAAEEARKVEICAVCSAAAYAVEGRWALEADAWMLAAAAKAAAYAAAAAAAIAMGEGNALYELSTDMVEAAKKFTSSEKIADICRNVLGAEILKKYHRARRFRVLT